MKNYKLIIGLSLLIILICPQLAQAAFPNLKGLELIPPECRQGGGKGCDLDSFLQLFINFSQLLLAALTIFTLLIFVWNSFGLATSMGKPEAIQKSKQGMVGAVFGMVIVLTAWALINTVVCILVSDSGNEECQIFERPWWGSGQTDCRDQEPYRSGDCGSGPFKLNCSDGPNEGYGRNINAIQGQLLTKGCNPGSIDGCFGPQTENAVKAFQVANGLEATGIVGADTSSALADASSNNCLAGVEPGSEGNCCIPFDSSLSCYSATECDDGISKTGSCDDYPLECTVGCCKIYNEEVPPQLVSCSAGRQSACTTGIWQMQSCVDLLECSGL